MKTPAFWFYPPGHLARLLKPLGRAYYALGQLRSGDPVHGPVPLIVVGNVVAGGAGKTPVVMALAELLKQRGLKVHLMAKGYGGQLKGPLQVKDSHTAKDVGDEPLLLREIAPTFIGRDRGAAYKLAVQGADIVISDDGMQSPRLAPDLLLLVVDGVLRFGNNCLIPAGPLREPLARALSRVDGVIQVGGLAVDYVGLPLVLADFVPKPAEELQGAKIIAFAGIGQPEKFFATCNTSGARVLAAYPFADHHPYSEAEIKRLIAEAKSQNAVLVTTTKDMVRIPPHLRSEVRVIEGKLQWREMKVIESLINRLLEKSGKHPS